MLSLGSRFVSCHGWGRFGNLSCTATACVRQPWISPGYLWDRALGELEPTLTAAVVTKLFATLSSTSLSWTGYVNKDAQGWFQFIGLKRLSIQPLPARAPSLPWGRAQHFSIWGGLKRGRGRRRLKAWHLPPSHDFWKQACWYFLYLFIYWLMLGSKLHNFLTLKVNNIKWKYRKTHLVLFACYFPCEL